jgi:hypothetical protein
MAFSIWSARLSRTILVNFPDRRRGGHMNLDVATPILAAAAEDADLLKKRWHGYFVKAGIFTLGRVIGQINVMMR